MDGFSEYIIFINATTTEGVDINVLPENLASFSFKVSLAIISAVDAKLRHTYSIVPLKIKRRLSFWP